MFAHLFAGAARCPLVDVFRRVLELAFFSTHRNHAIGPLVRDAWATPYGFVVAAILPFFT